ncbi:N-formylglutamate amidohydrolase [Roseovarius sp. 2305UL8-3]|uniref:N-formylglutamate amidohydrolase n=1 Tax=Roseovarius conchicola TaxID=3121636 RepID=UPI0035292259
MPEQAEKSVETLNPKGLGPVVILCEHASNHIPERYDGLGLSDEARISHAAWDPGARDMCLLLSKALDAPVVASCVSRLVYDCNRPPDSRDAMTERSETIDIPGNRGLSDAQRQERVDTVYRPFCEAVDAVLDARAQPAILVTMHSFTPVYFGQDRAVEIGILHDEDARLADAMLAGAPSLPHRRIERNEPYGPADGVTHSLIEHGVSRGLANVMLEIRNDLIRDADGVETLAQDVLTLLAPALAKLDGAEMQHA